MASGSTRTEPPYEPGLTAKEVATRYNDWEAREKEGKADLREAAELVLRHERSGGNPAPYLRRIKYSVYEAIRAYRGETRQGGDKQRGEWFAEVKKLPDETKSLSRLVAIYDAARGKGEPAGRASSQPTATAAPAR